MGYHRSEDVLVAINVNIGDTGAGEDQMNMADQSYPYLAHGDDMRGLGDDAATGHHRVRRCHRFSVASLIGQIQPQF